MQDAVTIQKIPAQPISYGEALKLQRHITAGEYSAIEPEYDLDSLISEVETLLGPVAPPR